ncbi:unnamed protein product [Durusdinium trenchii]|uniref:Uncharacterized protein n=1 Tax=Durusdinium trenchii TaxID=1381693 RepID=A0ABP0QAV1_9DINO
MVTKAVARKKQVMILSSTPVLGKGSSRSKQDDSVVDTDSPLNMNMIGDTHLTHFLSAVLPISLYNDKPESLHQVLAALAADFRQLFTTGVTVNGKKFFICVIGCKGDCPYLVKAGRFDRSFARRPLKRSSKKACPGICHLCLAGKETDSQGIAVEIPYEDYGTEQPAWLETMGVEPAYEVPSAFAAIPFLKDGAQGGLDMFFQFDLFHNLHLGLGKNFIASAICVCMELINNSIAGAFEDLTRDFRAYCQRNRQSPYHKTLSASLLGVEGGFQDVPDAAWNKGDHTRLLLQWFEDYCSREVLGKTRDPLYILCAEATMAINECVGGLYKEGLFVKAPRAEYLATKGLVFLQRYRQLAVMCFRLRKKRFPLMPKGHYLHHQFLSMLHASRQGPWCINILVYANQMSEDFVGKPSRLSRRVSAKTASLRVLQRSFLAIRNSICSTLDLGDLKLGT